MIARSSKAFLLFSILVASNVSYGACEQQRFLFTEGQRLYRSKQFLLSAVHLSQARSFNCDEELRAKAWVGYALSVSQLDEPTEAIATIRLANAANLDSKSIAALKMLNAWISNDPSQLENEPKSRLSLWESHDKKDYQTQLESSDLNPKVKADLIELKNKIDHSPHKSALGAALASAVLPGAGQAYIGNWQSAAVALALNAIALGATVDFSKRGMSGPAIASGFVFSVTYIGNVVGAAKSAHAYNEVHLESFERDTKMLLLPELTF